MGDGCERAGRLRRYPDAHGSQRAQAVRGAGAERTFDAMRTTQKNLTSIDTTALGNLKTLNRSWRKSCGSRLRIRATQTTLLTDPTAGNFFGEPGYRTIYRRTLLIAPWLNPYRYVNPTNGTVTDTFTYDGQISRPSRAGADASQPDPSRRSNRGARRVSGPIRSLGAVGMGRQFEPLENHGQHAGRPDKARESILSLRISGGQRGFQPRETRFSRIRSCRLATDTPAARRILSS